MSNPSGRRRVRDHIPAEDLPEYTGSVTSQFEVKDAGWLAEGSAPARLELIDDILAQAAAGITHAICLFLIAIFNTLTRKHPHTRK